MPTALCWPLSSPPAALSIAAAAAAAAASASLPASPSGFSTPPPARTTARASSLSSRSERRVGTAGYIAVVGRTVGGWAFRYQASFRIPATSTRFSGSVLRILDRRYIASGTTVGRVTGESAGLIVRAKEFIRWLYWARPRRYVWQNGHTRRDQIYHERKHNG